MFRFGFPLVVGMILHTSFNLIDMFMISRLENATAALAALGLCDMIAALATILSNGISNATVAIISRRVGRKFLTGVRRATYQSLLLVGFFAVVFGVLGVFFSDAIVRDVMQAKGEAADLAAAYLQVMLGGCYGIFFLLQITAILRALGHAKSAAMLLIGGNVLNIVLNVFLIYGSGPYPSVFAWAEPIGVGLGIPRLGVVGAAWATLIGRTVPVLIGAALLVRRRGGPKFHRVYFRPMWRELRELLVLGWPSSAQLVVRVGAVLVFISLVNANFTTPSDQTTLTAFSICLRLETMILFVGMGWGAAASSYVGMNLGAGHARRAHRSGLVASGYALLTTALLVALYLGFSEPIIGFFDPSPGVLQAGDEYLHRIGWTYLFVGVAVVLSQAMTGAGATFASMVLDASILVLLVVPAAYVVVEVLHLPRTALWWTIAVGNVVAAAAYVAFYGKGSFLRTKIY